MSDREAHGMNCAHRSDSDEPCTCACRYHTAVDTERTMHAAWRKRAEEAERENADLRAKLEAAERERDDQKAQREDDSKTHEKFIDELWQAIIVKHSPDYGDWEYPAQAFRHLVAEVDFVRERLAAAEVRVVDSGATANAHQEYAESLKIKLADAEKARDEQAEAVKILAAEVDAAWKWHDADPWDRLDTWDDSTSAAVRNTPIAAAAVKEASEIRDR